MSVRFSSWSMVPIFRVPGIRVPTHIRNIGDQFRFTCPLVFTARLPRVTSELD